MPCEKVKGLKTLHHETGRSIILYVRCWMFGRSTSGLAYRTQGKSRLASKEMPIMKLGKLLSVSAHTSLALHCSVQLLGKWDLKPVTGFFFVAIHWICIQKIQKKKRRDIYTHTDQKHLVWKANGVIQIQQHFSFWLPRVLHFQRVKSTSTKLRKVCCMVCTREIKPSRSSRLDLVHLSGWCWGFSGGVFVR